MKSNMEFEEDMIFGIRPVIEILKNGKEIDRLYIQQGLRSDQSNELFRLLKEKQVQYKMVPQDRLNRFTRKNHQGVICFISPIEFYRTEEVLPGIFEKGKIPFLLVLDRVTDVRNFGAIARTAECAGVNAIIIPSIGSAPVNGDALKTSAGALSRIKICKERNLKETIKFLKISGLKIVACTEKGEKPVFSADLNGPVAIILGSEEDGVSPAYLDLCDQRTYIPMKGTIQSLNVSVAAGIISFEVIRQRGKF